MPDQRHAMVHIPQGIEALLLAAGGAAMGSAVAYGGVRALQMLLPPNTFADESVVELNLPVLFFAVALALITVLLFGLAPAWELVQRNRVSSLRDMSKSAGDPGRNNWLRDTFVVTQVAISLVLLMGATLLLRSLVSVYTEEIGWDPKTVAIATPVFAPGDSNDADRRRLLMDRAVSEVRALPGVRSAAQSNLFPIAFAGVPVEMSAISYDPAKTTPAMASGDDAGLLDAAGYRIARGRWLTDTDVAGKRKVAVINQALARLLNISAGPLGQQVVLHLAKTAISCEVVCVLEDTPNQGMRNPVLPAIHLPTSAFPSPPGNLVVRANGRAAALVEPVRRRLGEALPNTRFIWVQPLDYYLPELDAHRFALVLLGAFAVAGLALTLIGLYAVMSYAVAKRSYEVGLRMALGARALQVVRLVATRGALIVTIGSRPDGKIEIVLTDSKLVPWAGGSRDALGIPNGVEFYADLLRVHQHDSWGMIFGLFPNSDVWSTTRGPTGSNWCLLLTMLRQAPATSTWNIGRAYQPCGHGRCSDTLRARYDFESRILIDDRENLSGDPEGAAENHTAGCRHQLPA